MTVTVKNLGSDAVREASARWLEAVGARDIGRIASFYAEDGLFLVPNAPVAQGHTQVRGVWSQLLSAPSLSLAWTPAAIEVAQAGDLASEFGTYRLAMDGPTGRVEDDGKYIVVWRKRDGDWFVVADIFNSSRPVPST